MPFPFVLGTTSHLNFQQNFTSTTHPSLPSAATAQRNIVRSLLKSHKRLDSKAQADSLASVLAALTKYLDFLLTIDAALTGRPISGEEVELTLVKEVEVEWRPTLSTSTVPGREADRVKGRGLDYEIYFAHHTYAAVQNQLARSALLNLYASTTPTQEQKASIIQNASRCLKAALSVHVYLVSRANTVDGPPSFPPQAVDIAVAVQSALHRLANAEFNLVCVLKDDPYPAVLVQSRNANDREWMIKAPEIPKVRAQVLTRLCIGAAEHAAAAKAMLQMEGNRRVSRDLIEYVEDVRRTARARACRFQAVDSDMAGETGKAIAWLYGAMNELGIETPREDGDGSSALGKLKSAWNERREDKRIEKADSKWGRDGGRLEETRILDFLHRKFSKANSTVNVQLVPDWRPLTATLPGGMNMPIDTRWQPPLLTENELAPMRGSPDPDDYPQGASSGEDEDDTHHHKPAPVGAFPVTKDESPTSYY